MLALSKLLGVTLVFQHMTHLLTSAIWNDGEMQSVALPWTEILPPGRDLSKNFTATCLLLAADLILFCFLSLGNRFNTKYLKGKKNTQARQPNKTRLSFFSVYRALHGSRTNLSAVTIACSVCYSFWIPPPAALHTSSPFTRLLNDIINTT